MQRYNVLIGFVLAVLIFFGASRLPLPEGWARVVPFVVAAGAFCLCAFAWKSKPGA